MQKKVLVALSGGVDSAVAAAMLQKEGYQVFGATMDTGIGNAAKDGAQMAEFFKIPHYVLDIREEFAEKVINYFCQSYLKGETPNPCVLCNRELKFRVFDELMAQYQIDYFATGHYVNKGSQNGRYYLRKANYLPKDQSYFLYALSQGQLSKAIFPLGGFSKAEVREKAKGWQLPVAEKKDSQDICFIPEGGYRAVLEKHVTEKLIPGPIYHKNGALLGEHEGLAYYTIGQRKGLGLARPKPTYVIRLDSERNALIVGEEEDIYTDSAIIIKNNFMLIENLKQARKCDIKVRSNSSPSQGKISLIEEGIYKNSVLIEFDKPERAVAPGQSAVYYADDILIGGGKIYKAFNK